MSKHTEGPWKAHVSVSDGNGWTSPTQWVTVSAGEVIVACYDTGSNEYPSDDTNTANANLIAAAPDLLEALQDMIDTGFVGGPQGARAKKAIAKATGPTP